MHPFSAAFIQRSSLEGSVRWTRRKVLHTMQFEPLHLLSLHLAFSAVGLRQPGPDSCHLLALWPQPQFPHPQNEGTGFQHSRDAPSPFPSSPTSSSWPRATSAPASSTNPPFFSSSSTLCLTFCSAPSALMDLLKLQKSIEVALVGFLCTVINCSRRSRIPRPRTWRWTCDCTWMYIAAWLIMVQLLGGPSNRRCSFLKYYLSLSSHF